MRVPVCRALDYLAKAGGPIVFAEPERPSQMFPRSKGPLAMTRYWTRFVDGFPVMMPRLPEPHRRWIWSGIYGFGLGDWFFGAIKGCQAPPTDAPATKGEAAREPEHWAAFNDAGYVYALSEVEDDQDGSAFRAQLSSSVEIRAMPRLEACRLHLAYLATLPEFAVETLGPVNVMRPSAFASSKPRGPSKSGKTSSCE